MIRKTLGMALAITLLSTTPVFAMTQTADEYKAAPALAVEILEQHGAEASGEVLKLVAQNVGPRGSFMGVEKTDPMYQHEVMHYLHHTLNAIDMDHDACMHHGMME